MLEKAAKREAREGEREEKAKRRQAREEMDGEASTARRGGSRAGGIRERKSVSVRRARRAAEEAQAKPQVRDG